jgi:hypothetical protein
MATRGDVTHVRIHADRVVRAVLRSIVWGHGLGEERELAAVVAYWSGKDGQRCEAHSDHVACSGGTGGI